MGKENQEFSDEKSLFLAHQNKAATLFVLGKLSIPAFLSFWIPDLLLVPDKQYLYLLIRSLVIPFSLLGYYLTKKTNDLYRLQLITSVTIILIANILNCLNIILDQPNNPYFFFGICMVTSVGLSFMPLLKRFFLITAIGIFLPYFTWFYLKKSLEPDFISAFIVQLYLGGGFVSTSYLIRFFTQKSKENEFHFQMSLKNEIAHRDYLIKRKTEEGIQLEKLTSQFSPQVVKAIKDRTIKLSDEAKKAEICTLFVDIVRSTEKVNILPEKSIKLVLSRFLGTTVEILLKYDITIDKFQGDGLLAFCNEPVKYDDFIQRVALAALEINEQLKVDRDFYRLFWGEELMVRTGAATGYAYVGFYGDKHYFNSFTAIGSPLALASRLTAAAEPNCIIVDETSANYLIAQGFALEALGRQYLKGFENYQINAFKLLDKPKELKRYDFL